ncbi:Uu.00g138770.m01.CDS01 [Anthostomella pinea]|uniref:Uu.00g138770.m01.CDS01 n=1 Tax=Anthostomella pinea TaxID=933095 RepID=A0AAI8YIT9_9PEZI|nr:Uu.00g138770.m01.CDS01 [Anthostomella pinea]
MPNFGATFYPGGMDDFYMPPEVVAPAPQRIMPEVPQNMQQGLQRMELEAREVPQHSRDASLSNVLNTRVGGFGQQYQQGGKESNNYSPASNFSPFHETQDTDQKFEKNLRDMRELPSFSPFPKVQGEHIPPSDEEKETVLAESRQLVLHSNDPNMQICWARDVLSYVETAAEAAIREADAARDSRDQSSSRPATPKIEHELRVDAMNIVSYLADQGHPEAIFIRSKWVEFGKFGKRQDKKEAYSGYMAAAQQGWGRADYRIGMLYENSNDTEKAMRHYHMGLEAKDSAASYRLGMVNLLGQRGLPKDIPKGLDLIHQAADTADEDAPQGAFVYGMLIARDLPDVNIPEGMVSLDIAVARQYIEKAAYLGFAKAQLKMGQAYELCQLGCDFDPALSLHYYGLAARQGQPEACLGVSRWFLFGYEGTFAKNEQLAFKYAQLAAKTKLPTGEFAMGYYYEIGIFVEKDLREARKWYELAAEHGNKDAVGRLDGLSHSQSLSKKDHETSTLGRIKSKHGSQRGQRPERFKQINSSMPTVSEDRSSPRVSPNPSPRNPNFDHTNMPDPSRPGNMAKNNRAPPFTVNLAERPRSAVPYPEDDRPAPLNLSNSRPTSAAPYPEDDMIGSKPQLSPHYNPNIRSSGAPAADRPGSSLVIRSQSPGGRPGGAMRPSQSAGQLPVPSGMDSGRGRPASAGWQSQAPGGYRQPSPGPRAQDYRAPTGQYDQRPQSGYDGRSGGGPGPNNPAPNRLAKTGPSAGRGGPRPSGYGARESSLPMPHAPGPRASSGAAPYDSSGGRSSAAPAASSPTMSGGLGTRTSSIPQQGLPQGGPGGQRMGGGGRPGVSLTDRPMPMDDHGGRSSAPPSQARPGMASPAPSTATNNSVASAPAARPPPKAGPATFEQMGIPQAKKDDDCVVM